jgi:hypothetical protein
MCESEQVASFFDQIGRNNASHIRNMCIDFPDIRNVDDDVNIEDDSARILANIQSDCANLNKIVTSLRSTNDMVLKLDALDGLKIVAEALALVDASFRVISSL